MVQRGPEHDLALRHGALAELTSQVTRLSSDADYDAVLTVKARRDRLDAVIEQPAADSEFTPGSRSFLGVAEGGHPSRPLSFPPRDEGPLRDHCVVLDPPSGCPSSSHSCTAMGQCVPRHRAIAWSR